MSPRSAKQVLSKHSKQLSWQLTLPFYDIVMSRILIALGSPGRQTFKEGTKREEKEEETRLEICPNLTHHAGGTIVS